MPCKSAARRGNCVTNPSRSQCNQPNCLPAKKRMLRCKAFIHKCSKTFSIAWTKRTRRFFRRGHGFPRFKGKGWFDSFTYPQLGFRVEGSQVSLAKIGNVKIHLHRPLAGDIKTLTLKNENGKWYACFSCMVDSEPLPFQESVVGIDVGLESFAVTSDAEIVDNPRWFRQAQKKLRVRQRHVNRCRKRSSGWRKACKLVARLDRHVFNQRNDFQHKVSREFVENYGLIAVEDLNVKGLAGGRLAKSVHDAAWSSFIAKLLYKAESADRLLVKVEARGTSQQCPCGAPVPKKLWDRKHHCTVLRVKHDPRPRIGIGNTTARTAPKNLNACNSRHGS